MQTSEYIYVLAKLDAGIRFFQRAQSHILGQIHCVYLITLLKIRFWRVTPQKRPEIDGITKQTQADLLA